jgi:hypothetical protein
MANQAVTLGPKKAKLTETWKVTRSRKANDELRGKRHLTPAEIKAICKALRQRSRHKDRDECMVLVAFHHGLRVGELTNIKWQHIDLKAGQMAIKRLKNGIDTVHPISDARELMLVDVECPASVAPPVHEPLCVNGSGARHPLPLHRHAPDQERRVSLKRSRPVQPPFRV